ncbi:hypothetical protein TUM12370_21500 [Salmonella enterica subsp. enterica serovar Choleraesuis]|nr:hypothetical protein TUM12370_21500 [Salmonella enterica subsp. enterica serovar Choleraesuis]
MHWQHSATATGQRLASEHPISGFHTQFTLRAEMLLYRYNELGWQRHLAHWRSGGDLFHLRRMNTAVKVPEFS